MFRDDHLPPQQDIINFLRSEGYDEENVRVLCSGRTYDVISPEGGKAQAIARIANLRGLDSNSIARVGDQGKPGQNDYDMLQHPLGFTVGERDETNQLALVFKRVAPNDV